MIGQTGVDPVQITAIGTTALVVLGVTGYLVKWLTTTFDKKFDELIIAVRELTRAVERRWDSK